MGRTPYSLSGVPSEFGDMPVRLWTGPTSRKFSQFRLPESGIGATPGVIVVPEETSLKGILVGMQRRSVIGLRLEVLGPGIGAGLEMSVDTDSGDDAEQFDKRKIELLSNKGCLPEWPLLEEASVISRC